MDKPDADDQFEELSRISRRSLMQTTLGLLAAGSAIPQLAASVNRSQRQPEDEAYWAMVADQFLIKPDITYMNTGTRGPSPAGVYLAQIEAIRASNEDRLGYVNQVYTQSFKAGLRTRLADFLGADASEIAITNNTTEGMGIGTLGLDLKAGDEIVYTNHDHSSGGQPINLRAAREGIKPVMVDLSDPKFHPPRSPDTIVNAFEAAITPRTKLISFCHVNYTDGCVMPVKEICELARSKGIVTLVDGAHPPGMLEMNLHDLGCDMYAGACHKWMLAAQLTGFLFVREEMQERIWPAIYSGPVQGRNMYGAPDDAEKGRTAERYETHGSTNYAAGKSIDAALDFHEQIGPAAIEARDRYLATHARTELLNMSGVEVFAAEDARMCAGLVSFRVRGVDTRALSKFLWNEHRMYLREVRHEEINWDANRLSLHVMVTKAGLDRTLAAIEEVARQPALVPDLPA